MIKSNDYPEKSPEWTLARFLEAWEKRSWKAMLKYCQLSWVNPPSFVYSILLLADVRIRKLFRHKLLSAKILKTEKISDVTTDIKVDIHYKDVNIKKKMTRKARVICEVAPMRPSVDGTYGVNPTSLIKARR